MGRGGGSHRSGGGGGGHRSHSHSHSHSSHRSSSHYHSRGGGGDARNSLSSLVILSCFFFFFFVCLVLGLILTLVTGSRIGDICDGITSINMNEQRTCKPTKKEDVRIPEMAAWVSAFLYENDKLPPIEVHSTEFTYNERVYDKSWKSFDFALMEGGTVEFNYQISGSRKGDFYLMNLEQYRSFTVNKRARDYLWAITGNSSAIHEYKATSNGLYFIVVDNQGYSTLNVNEYLNITTGAYKVSKETAKDSCIGAKSCKFKKVLPTETVIVNYSGSSTYVDLEVYHGKGSFNKGIIAPLAFMIVFIMLFGVLWLVCFVKALKKCGKKAKKAAEKAAENAADGTAKVSQPVAAPGVTPMTPVGPTLGGAPPYPGYDPAMGAAAAAPPYGYPGMDNPYPDGMPPPDPMNPYGAPAPAYGADPSGVPYPGQQPPSGVPSTTV